MMAWKSVVLAFIFAIIATREISAATIIMGEEGPEDWRTGPEDLRTRPIYWHDIPEHPGFGRPIYEQINLHAELLQRLWQKIVTSSENVEDAAYDMGNNFWDFYRNLGDQLGSTLHGYAPHIKEFIEAIPAKALHKMTTDSLRTALKQHQEQCYEIYFQYNPIHPGLTPRKKRETEAMTLAKFGEAISTLFTDVDQFVVEYIKKSAPLICTELKDFLENLIAKAEDIDPEDLKEFLSL